MEKEKEIQSEMVKIKIVYSELFSIDRFSAYLLCILGWMNNIR